MTPASPASEAAAPVEEPGIAVSVLHDREWLGEITLETGGDEAASGRRFDVGASGRPPRLSALYGRTAFQLDKGTVCRGAAAQGRHRPAAIQLVHIPDHDLAAHRARQHKIQSGFPERGPVPRSAERWARTRPCSADTSPAQSDAERRARICLSAGRRSAVRHGSTARLVHALSALEEAGRLLAQPAWREAGRAGSATASTTS